MCLTIRLSASYSTCLFIVLSKERAETTILRASAHSKKGLSGSGPDVLVQGFNNITRAFLLNLILIPIITPARYREGTAFRGNSDREEALWRSTVIPIY